MIDADAPPKFPFILCCGDEDRRVPDCIVLRCNSEQRSVYRKDGETPAAHWHRVLWSAYCLTVEKSPPPHQPTFYHTRWNEPPRAAEPQVLWPVVMVCQYSVKDPGLAEAQKEDALQSRRMVLTGGMLDPTATWEGRVKAAIEMSDLLWPQLRGKC